MKKVFLFLVAVSFCPNLKSQIVAGGDCYIKGNLVEIGIDGSGGFEGAYWNPFSPPLGGMHYRSNTSYFGFVANPQMDGWTNFDGDFFTPGANENGWGCEIGSTGFLQFGNNCINYSDQIPGSITSYTVDGDCRTVVWDGNLVSGGYNLHFKITYRLKLNDLYYTTTVAITNNGATTIPDFYYYRTVDPDNNASIDAMSYTTTNTIISNPNAACNKAHLSATSNSPWFSYFGFAGVGANFRVAKGGFSNRDGSDIWHGTGGMTTSGTSTADEGVSLAYRIQNFTPGMTETFKYVIILDDAAANNAIQDLFYFTYTGSLSGPAPDCAPVTSVASTCSGQPVAITLNATGGALSGFTWTWSPATGLSATTGTVVNAAPSTTTTYTVTGTSPAACFAPINQQIQVNVVPGPLATYVDPGPQCGSFNLSSLVHDDANNVPGALFNFYTVPPTSLSMVGSNIYSGGPLTPSSPTVYLAYYDPTLGCVDYIPININWSVPAPVVASTSICNGSSTTLTATGATTYTWSPATGLSATTGASVTASPTTTTTYTITGTSGPGCSATTTATVTVNPNPVISANNPLACSGDPAVITASGATTYTWSPATGLSATTGATVTATVATTTTYTVTGTSLGCTGTATATVTMSPLLDPTVTPAGPYCQSASPAAMVAVDAGGTWSASCGTCIDAATGVFNPSLATVGANTVTYTIPGGCGGTDDITINVNAVPDVVATPAGQTICSGTAPGIALSSAVAGTTFDWTVSVTNISGASNGSGANINQTLTSTLAPGGNAVYTVTPTSPAGCIGTPINVTINVEEVVINNIVTTDALCAGSTDGTITITATGATEYSIDNGVTFVPTNVFNVGAGTYSIIVRNANACQATGTAIINEPAPLTVISGQNDITCFGACDGNATGFPSGGTSPYSFSWGAAGTTPVIDNLCAGTYTLIVTDNHNCTATTSVTLVDPVQVTINSIPTVQPTCNGGNSGSMTINATNATQYSINGGAFQASNSFDLLTAGTYNVVASDASGCTATTVVIIDEPTPVTIGASADANICLGGSATISAAGSGGNAPYTYTWDNGLPPATIHNVSPTVTTVYNVSMVDANGCGPVTESITVSVNAPLQVETSPNLTICPGGTASISALATGGGAPYTYTWTNTNNSSIIVSQSGNVSPTATAMYTVTVTDACGTPAASDTMMVFLYSLPSVNYTADNREGCQPVVVNFDNLTANEATIEWDFGDGTTGTGNSTQHVFNQPGCYDIAISVTTNDGCVVDSVITNMICVYPVPVADFTFAPIPTDVFNPEITFTNLSLGGGNYLWDFASLESSNAVNPVFEFPADSGGVYNVCLTTTTNYGCWDTTCHKVTIHDQFLVYVPNAFTPDGDGINEIFLPKIQGENPDSYEFMVFNRWGQLVFQTTNTDQGWDGTHNGIKVKEDVYVWKIKVKKKVNQDKLEYHGTVNLLR